MARVACSLVWSLLIGGAGMLIWWGSGWVPDSPAAVAVGIGALAGLVGPAMSPIRD